jgi:hypothetical protein
MSEEKPVLTEFAESCGTGRLARLSALQESALVVASIDAAALAACQCSLVPCGLGILHGSALCRGQCPAGLSIRQNLLQAVAAIFSGCRHGSSTHSRQGCMVVVLVY